MSTVIQELEQALFSKHDFNFSPGDTVCVWVKVFEGAEITEGVKGAKGGKGAKAPKAIKERLQAFEGVVIAKKNRGINSSFTVRKISHGEGVERVFQTHSPLIDKIELKRRGKVRRAKLYYLRDLAGRAARIKEDLGKTKKEKENKQST